MIMYLTLFIVWIMKMFVILLVSMLALVIVVVVVALTYICSKVLYRFYNLVEDRLDQLMLLDVDSVKFYKKDDEIGYWTLDKHKEYEKYRNKFKSNKGNGDNKGSSLLVITPTGYEYAQ